jgi:AraC family transcriptional regulator
MTKHPQTPPLQIAHMPAIRLAGLIARYPATPEAMRLLGAQWQQFSRSSGGRIMDAGAAMYGVHVGLFGDGGEDEYFSGVEISERQQVPEGLIERRLPAVTCAVADHEGTVGEISHATSHLLRDAIPVANRRLAANRPFDLIERYGKDFDPVSARGGIQLIIPVED